MKKVFIKDLKEDIDTHIYGWVKSRRNMGGVTFLDLQDSTGTIQVVINHDKVNIFEDVRPEDSVEIEGAVVKTLTNNNLELQAISVKIIGKSDFHISPSPRSDINIFSINQADHFLKNRHLYIRNEKIVSILKYRSQLTHWVREWFHENEFTSIDAPILTPIPLYEDGSAISVSVHNENVFLTQCVGFYLEAATHAFEKVYNMGPSFRGEESRSKRHLMEYHHIKAEVAFADLEDIISLVESLLSHIAQKTSVESKKLKKVLGSKISIDGLSTPYPRISYEEAIKELKKKKVDIEFGVSLGSSEEEILSEMFDSPFWVTGIPRSIEPFPYCIDNDDPRVARVADLIASNGYGELLGVAEKISDINELETRLSEKGKQNDPRYEWVKDTHRLGPVPHAAFGMGLERLIRWMLDIPHVRDTIPFPRTFKRSIYP